MEEVGLRRTVLRDASGTVHSVSNGQIRTVSNLTRIYASAVVDMPGIAERDIEATIAVMDRVGAELAADPAWAGSHPRGAALRVHDRVHGPRRHAAHVRSGQGVGDRWAVPAELRRRLGPALREAGVEPNRRALSRRRPRLTPGQDRPAPSVRRSAMAAHR